nr:hypothetical protein [uncultured Cohaesibacter sp.]
MFSKEEEKLYNELCKARTDENPTKIIQILITFGWLQEYKADYYQKHKNLGPEIHQKWIEKIDRHCIDKRKAFAKSTLKELNNQLHLTSKAELTALLRDEIKKQSTKIRNSTLLGILIGIIASGLVEVLKQLMTSN